MRDHQWFEPRTDNDRCRAPSHDRTWDALTAIRIVCWSCRTCWWDADSEGCPARLRPGYPEQASRAVEVPGDGTAGEESAPSLAAPEVAS